MRKIFTILAICSVFGAAAIFVTKTSAAKASMASVKILNDSSSEVSLHTGSGFVSLNKGASTSITCEAGTEISLADKGKKKGVLFTIDESMCGKTVKLSKYL